MHPPSLRSRFAAAVVLLGAPTPSSAAFVATAARPRPLLSPSRGGPALAAASSSFPFNYEPFLVRPNGQEGTASRSTANGGESSVVTPIVMIALQLIAAVLLLLELNLIQVALAATMSRGKAFVNLLPLAAVAVVGFGGPVFSFLAGRIMAFALVYDRAVLRPVSRAFSAGATNVAAACKGFCGGVYAALVSAVSAMLAFIRSVSRASLSSTSSAIDAGASAVNRGARAAVGGLTTAAVSSAEAAKGAATAPLDAIAQWKADREEAAEARKAAQAAAAAAAAEKAAAEEAEQRREAAAERAAAEKAAAEKYAAEAAAAKKAAADKALAAKKAAAQEALAARKVAEKAAAEEKARKQEAAELEAAAKAEREAAARKKEEMWKKAYALAEKQLEEEAAAARQAREEEEQERALAAAAEAELQEGKGEGALGYAVGGALLFGALAMLADDDALVQDKLAAKRATDAKSSAAAAKAAEARLKAKQEALLMAELELKRTYRQPGATVTPNKRQSAVAKPAKEAKKAVKKSQKAEVKGGQDNTAIGAAVLGLLWSASAYADRETADAEAADAEMAAAEEKATEEAAAKAEVEARAAKKAEAARKAEISAAAKAADKAKVAAQAAKDAAAAAKAAEEAAAAKAAEEASAEAARREAAAARTAAEAAKATREASRTVVVGGSAITVKAPLSEPTSMPPADFSAGELAIGGALLALVLGPAVLPFL